MKNTGYILLVTAALGIVFYLESSFTELIVSVPSHIPCTNNTKVIIEIIYFGILVIVLKNGLNDDSK